MIARREGEPQETCATNPSAWGKCGFFAGQGKLNACDDGQNDADADQRGEHGSRLHSVRIATL